jgi:hypothetical protein
MQLSMQPLALLWTVGVAVMTAVASDRAADLAPRRASVPVAGLRVAPLDSLVLLPLDGLSAGESLPRRWVVRPVRGERAPQLSLIDSGGTRALRIAGSDRAAWIVRELDRPIDPGSGRLAWSWRVLEHPAGADLRARSADDAALRVFVVFEREGLFDRVPHTLFYTSGTVEGAGYERPSFQSADLHVIRMGDAASDDDWQLTVVDPFADYQRIWGGKPRKIVAVGLMQDSEGTESRATADIRALVWRSAIPAVAP